jgi:putative transposase
MTRAYRSRSRYTRATVPEELRDTSQWPAANTSHLNVTERLRMMRLRKITRDYLEFRPIAHQLKRACVTHKHFLKMLNRALSRDHQTGQILGWAGFLPGVLRKPYTRTADTSGAMPPGLAGALALCFERVPDLRKSLVRRILKRPTGPHEVRVSKADLHKDFLGRCTTAGLKDDDWPFNARFEGRRAIERFYDKVLLENYERGVRAQQGADAASKLRTGTGRNSLIIPCLPYDLAEMDAHRLHLTGTVGIPDPEGLIEWVPIERIQLLVIGDGKSTTALGYAAVIRRECNGDDVLDAGYSVIAPWRPRELCLTSLRYDEGGGLPSGVIPELAGCGFCILCLDNALIGLGKDMIETFAGRFGCALNWGAIGRWDSRALIERIFCALEELGFVRAPSSTGSNANDPRRENPGKAAVEARIHFQVILDLIDLQLARYNIAQSEGRFAQKRLNILRQYVERPELGFWCPKLPPTDGLHPELNISVNWGYVRGCKRRPSTKYERVIYTNTTLANSPELVGQRVVRHINRHNIRDLELFDALGAPLGTVRADYPWSEHDHSLEMRKQINRRVDDGRIVAQHNQD